MATSRQIGRIVFITVGYLYCFLFLYAAVSKIRDFDNFQIQIGQSPLLSAFAESISYAVIAIEIVIAVLLLVEKFRRLGLYLGFVLMAMFSAYIFFIMNFAAFVPCSCGGVLENMNWGEHLAFNLLFVFLGFSALLISRPETESAGRVVKATSILSLGSVLLITILFIVSEIKTHQRNGFIRRFPGDHEVKSEKLDLGFNSYYFAGVTDTIYLGNTSAPRHVLIISKDLKSKKAVVIDADAGKITLSNPQLRVLSPNFFIFDGTAGCVFQGQTSKWKATSPKILDRQFTLAEPAGPSTFIFRGWHPRTKENVLGKLDLNGKDVALAPNLLEKQIDGVFDTDGILLVDQNRMLYIYYYRNQVILFDRDLKSLGDLHTIDTVSKANIKVGKLAQGKTSKLAAPPMIVNRLAAIDGQFLFINSPRLGRFEDKEIWKHADVIDVYDTFTGDYLSSFYVYKEKDKSLSSFRVHNGQFYGLHEEVLTTFKLDKMLFKKH